MIRTQRRSSQGHRLGADSVMQEQTAGAVAHVTEHVEGTGLEGEEVKALDGATIGTDPAQMAQDPGHPIQRASTYWC